MFVKGNVMAELAIYRASAGAGKTHILVTRYIQWALRYPDAFKNILAVTFTNRATQEMKQRILAYLYSLSIGEATVLQERLYQEGWTSTQLQVRSKEVLSMMVYHYGDCAVTTIDRFFHRMIQSFAKVLGLQHHFSVEMDERLALKQTVEELFTLDDPFLQQWMVDFALTKLLVGKSWNIRSNIQELGTSLFNESFKLYEKPLLRAFQQQKAWPHFVLATQACVDSFERSMQKIGQAALTILHQENLVPIDFTYGTKGVIGYFLKLASKKGFTPTKRAVIAKDDLTSWYSEKKHNALGRVVEQLLHPLLVEAIDLYERDGLAYRTALVAARFTYAFGMIGALLIGLERYRSKNNVSFMSDISTLLYQAIQESDASFLYRKTGHSFHHFLIDEFQDLSLFQWMNIKPLLRNSLAQGYSSLLVGDVKQSIYRWRGSNWKLLNHQVEGEFKESTLHYLTTNRRSQEAIVLFNNYFFKTAANRLVDYLESSANFHPIDALSYEWAQMRRAYGDVVQQTNGQKGGHVGLYLFPSDQTDRAGDPMDFKVHAQKSCMDLLEQLQKEEIPAKDIVLLVRNNSEAALITNGWQTSHTTGRYEVRSDHAYALWSHIAVKVLIHSLYYLNDEDDLINKAAWVQAYWHCLHHDLAIGDHDRFYSVVDATSIKNLFPQPFWAQKDFLKNLSVYPCVALLITSLFKNPSDFADVLSFFQSVVLNFSLTKSDSIADFLVWWEKRGRAIPLPTSHHENVIKVMTIHQSKGLAFKVVIIPFCNWHLDHPPQNGPILWSVDQAQSAHFPIWPISYGVDLKETHYAKAYYLEQMQIHLDNLNLLYVAFTRAAERLYVMAPFPAQTEAMNSVADLIYQSLIKDQSNPLFKDELPLAVAVQKEAGVTKLCFGQ
ncbi:UvrD-helicase domain-containing protein [Candidatus Cardinium hertigii]|uniref:UvrD-helicase domain-containing protein n=1 Tax=Candidatus Cardinium hertigii TaxID=247481 RepID=UPI003D7EA0DD